MAGYLIELELSGRLAVVVGLGAVGRRKAEGLAAAGARVVGVDPNPADVPAGVDLVVEPYRAAHLSGAALAFAAATPEVNRRVVADARAAGIWANAAGGPEPGDFRVPATHRDGPLLLGVSTGGAGPALAATLRDRAAASLGPEAAALAVILAELRPLALARIADPAARRALLHSWADPVWLGRLKDEGVESIRAALRMSMAGA